MPEERFFCMKILSGSLNRRECVGALEGAVLVALSGNDSCKWPFLLKAKLLPPVGRETSKDLIPLSKTLSPTSYFCCSRLGSLVLGPLTKGFPYINFHLVFFWFFVCFCCCCCLFVCFLSGSPGIFFEHLVCSPTHLLFPDQEADPWRITASSFPGQQSGGEPPELLIINLIWHGAKYSF